MRAGASAVIALCLGGCSISVGNDGPAVDPQGERQATRAIWGIVPDAPKRKADLRSAMIRGAAVAVAPDTLLADCAAVAGKKRVGLVRHNKYRRATVARSDDGQLCRLTVAEGPLSPVTGYRSFADLRLGEPVAALASRTARDVVIARGWLAGKGDPADPFLEVMATLPPTSSAVLLDSAGNLLGLGAVAELPDATLLAVPVQPPLVPALANRDLGDAGILLAALTPVPSAQSRQPPILLPLGRDEGDGGDGARPARRDVAAAGDAGNLSAPGVGPPAGRTNGGSAGGSGSTAPGTGTGAGGTGQTPGAGTGGDPGQGGGSGRTAEAPGHEVAAGDHGHGRGRGGGRERGGGHGRGNSRGRD